MKRPRAVIAALTALVAGSLLTAPSQASTASRWWMADWNCKMSSGQKANVSYRILDNTTCDGDTCTTSNDAETVLTWRLVNGAGTVDFHVVAASSTIVTASDRPDGGATDFQFMKKPAQGGSARAEGALVLQGAETTLTCTTGSFASLEPLRLKKPSAKVDLGRLTGADTSDTVRKKASDNSAITKTAGPKIAVPDITE